MVVGVTIDNIHYCRMLDGTTNRLTTCSNLECSCTGCATIIIECICSRKRILTTILIQCGSHVVSRICFQRNIYNTLLATIGISCSGL